MNGTLCNLPLEDILIDQSFNCRGNINPSSVFPLAESIQKDGMHQPVIVRVFGEHEETFGKKYKLVAGFRRVTAARAIQLHSVPAIVRTDIDENKAQFINFSENLDRQDLSIWEEAQTIKHLMGKINPNTGYQYTEIEICIETGKSRGWIQPRLMLLKMPEPIQVLAKKGLVNATAIRDLNSYKDGDELQKEVKRLKEKSEKGESVVLKVKKPEKAKHNRAVLKRQRTRMEMNRLLDHLSHQYAFQGHVILRGIAWAAGNISDIDFCVDLQEAMAERGIMFTIPRDGFAKLEDGYIEDEEDVSLTETA